MAKRDGVLVLALLVGLSALSAGAEDDATLTYDPQTGVAKGKLQIDGGQCLVAAIDSDRDGLFDEFAYDRDGDGKILDAEVLPLGKIVEVKGQYYTFERKPEGNAVPMKQVKPRLGALDAGCADLVWVLASPECVVRVYGSEGKRQLPVGTYKTLAVGLLRTDKEGVQWKLAAAPDCPRLQAVAIKEGETLAFKVGSPLIVKPTGLSIRGKAIEMGGVSVVGQAGEQYPVAAQKDKKQQPAPGVSIVDKDGNVVVSAAFRYG